MNGLIIAAVAVGAYFLGNINTSILISRLKGRDIRTLGTGNPGTMNMIRNFGVKLGALTLLLDVLKGVLPTLIGWLVVSGIGFGADKLGAYVGGISVTFGHIFPVLLKFKGGKGIATSIGVCFVIYPLAALCSFVGGVAFILITKMGTLTSFIIISVPLAVDAYMMSVTNAPNALACHILLFFMFLLTVWAHRKNFVRLFKGTDSKTVLIKKKKKPEPEKTAA